MCTASPTYGIVFTCVVYKYPTIVIQWTFYTLNFQWLSIIIHSIIIICQAFCQSFCFAVGISSIRSVGPFLVQHSSCTLRASAIIQTLRIAFFMHTFRNKIYSEFCTPNFLLIYYCNVFFLSIVYNYLYTCLYDCYLRCYFDLWS